MMTSTSSGQNPKIFSGKLHPGLWVIGIALLTAGIHNSLSLTKQHSLIYPLFVGAVLGGGLCAYTMRHRRQMRNLHRNGEKIRRSEWKYRTFFENSTDAMLIIENGEFVDCNDAVVALLGYNRKEEIIHTHPGRLSPEFQPDGRPSAEKADEMMQLAKERGQHRFEWNHLRKDGVEIPVEVSLTAIENDGGTKLHTVWRDLTVRKQAEQEREKAYAFLQEVIDGIPEALMVINRDYIVALANRVARDVAGGDPTSGCLKCHQVYHHRETPCEDAEHPCPLDTVIETGKPVMVEHVHRNSEGGKQIVELTAAPVFDEKGEVIQIIESCRDITDRKQAEDALLASVQKLALHVEQTPLAVIGWDVDFRVTEWNPAAEKIFGYTQAEAMGQHATFIVPEAVRESTDEVMANLLTTEGGNRSDNENVTRDGELVVCEWYNTPLVDANGRVIGVASLALDITDRKQAEEEREVLEQQLRQAQKMEAVGQMAGGLAHDFNNLLQVIGGYAELLQMNLEPDNPVASAISEISKASLRGKELINQLLAFSRRHVLSPTDLNLNEIIAPLLKMIRGLIGEHIELDFIAGHNLGTVHADCGMIEQVLVNLCVNAHDAMPDGGTLTIETENVLIDGGYAKAHSWATPGHYVLLSVTDTGCGMDRKTTKRIFEPFFTTKEVGKGTGLGLSVAFGIVKQHSGNISVYSEEDKGSIFKIYLPTVERPAEEVSRFAPDPVVGETPRLF